MTDVLAAALHSIGSDCMRPIAASRDVCLPEKRAGAFHLDIAAALSAALTASGYSLTPTEELAGLRAIEEAARDANPTPGQAITSAPAIAALRAALEAKGPRP